MVAAQTLFCVHVLTLVIKIISIQCNVNLVPLKSTISLLQGSRKILREPPMSTMAILCTISKLNYILFPYFTQSKNKIYIFSMTFKFIM